MAKTTTNQSAETQPAQNKHEDFVLKYRNMIIGGIVAVIAIIAGIIFWNSHKAEQQEKAVAAAATPQMSYEDGLRLLSQAAEDFGEKQFAEALNGDSTGTKKGFLKIADEFSSTPAGNLANLYAGLCYAHMDKWAEAVKFLEKYDDSDDYLVSPAALAALGNAYAHQKQNDKAVESLTKAAEKADNYMLSPLFYIQAGEILEAQGKKADALKMYQNAKKYVRLSDAQDPDAALPFVTRIEEYIARVSE